MLVTASRLEELNKRYGTKNLISDKTFTSEGVVDKFQLRHVDRVVVKGRSKSTDLYEVCGYMEERLKDNVEKFNEVYAEAMKLYFAKKFSEAFEKFEEANKAKEEEEDDSSCMLLQQRCISYMENPPTEEWDGASVLTSK